jgi:hypothetical protein
LKSQKRDKEKTEWCEKNNIRQIVLAHNESESEWKEKLKDD